MNYDYNRLNKEYIKNDNSGVNNHNIILFLFRLWFGSFFYGFDRVCGLEMVENE